MAQCITGASHRGQLCRLHCLASLTASQGRSLQLAVQALQFYKRVQELPEYNDKELWTKIAECHEALGSQEDMVAMYEAIMQDNSFPAAIQHDAAVALTHLHLDAGNTVAAEQVRRCRTILRLMMQHPSMSLQRCMHCVSICNVQPYFPLYCAHTAYKQ